jgi:hypothetical protein
VKTSFRQAIILSSTMALLFWACEGPLPVSTKIVPSSGTTTVAFFQNDGTNRRDQITIEALCRELGFSFAAWTARFVNDEENWFDERGHRKLDIFVVPGGDSYKWFERKMDGSLGVGINENGCRNIVRFIQSGGSCISICHVGPALFAKTVIWTGLTGRMIEAGMKWKPHVSNLRGGMFRVYGINPIFLGTVKGPQESNSPYPRVRFLPVKLNQENSLVKRAKLPDTVYLMVAGGGSLIPDPAQPIEVIGWFPNETAAIAVLKHGNGHLFMVAPHPNITLDNSRDWMRQSLLGTYARNMGLNDRQINEAISILAKEGDPDGAAPDLTLMRAIFMDAAQRAALRPE